MCKNLTHISEKTFTISSGAVLSLSALFFIWKSIHWPIIGDASLMHYAVFLMNHGAAPYRDIYELNMPGSYLVEWVVMHTFGGGALGWRLFDLFLSLSATAAMMVIARPQGWGAGFWAGVLLLLIHGRDGIPQVGQRDLSLTVCLLVGYAFLFQSLRKNKPAFAVCFGLIAGLAAAIKPTMLLLAPSALVLVYWQLRKAGKPARGFVLAGLSGLLMIFAGFAAYLWREHALYAFMTTTREMVEYHAALGRRSATYLLLHSISPILPLALGWLVLTLSMRKRPGWEGAHLLVAMGVGMLSFSLQGKGFPYQRYPFLAFLLLIMAMSFAEATKDRRSGVRVLGFAGLAFGAFVLAPISSVKATEADWRNLGNISLLQRDLSSLDEDRLSGGVQCVDSISGCVNVLYRMKLIETSYVFYDEFLFGPASVPAVVRNREKFWADLDREPPAVIVVTAPLFPSGPDNYGKLAQWPQFAAYLQAHYSLAVQRTPMTPVKWWSRAEMPDGYRIYLRER
ncbi:hypothetical protein ACPOL_1695 [Acidisarcina polymorpha]|uniref:Uncharacterized protein n=1 Tax=Acidisarcina polymorpha TaxID=2211140 RepID=A0A2Z5FVW8_9BACT|nr:glycosyltransferase family 39 protein [Acidisarcina polymorpha]AXC11039.1 hypothetical protein ACPOL_1695 [Acidisarcina polymorpha]